MANQPKQEQKPLLSAPGGANVGRAASLPTLHARKRVNLRRREQLIGLASVLPAFLIVGVIVWFPIFRTFAYSLTDWNGAHAHWVGLDNFRNIFESGDLWEPLRTNLIFLFSIPGILIISLVVSVLLFEQVRGWTFFRSVYYLPTILSTAVVGMLMRVMVSPRGAVNDILSSIGLDSLTRNWLGETNTAFLVLISIFYWQTLGQGVLIFLAGLSAVPADLIEAAKLDGATWRQRLTQVLIPMLVPAISYFVIINAIYTFVGLFSLVYTVTEGGPGYSTTSLDLLIYRTAFEAGRLGYASAFSVILFLIVLVISGIQLRFFDRMTTD